MFREDKLNIMDFNIGDRVVAMANKIESGILIHHGERMTIISMKDDSIDNEYIPIINVRFDNPHMLHEDKINTWWITDEDLDLVKSFNS